MWPGGLGVGTPSVASNGTQIAWVFIPFAGVGVTTEVGGRGTRPVSVEPRVGPVYRCRTAGAGGREGVCTARWRRDSPAQPSPPRRVRTQVQRVFLYSHLLSHPHLLSPHRVEGAALRYRRETGGDSADVRGHVQPVTLA